MACLSLIFRITSASIPMSRSTTASSSPLMVPLWSSSHMSKSCPSMVFSSSGFTTFCTTNCVSALPETFLRSAYKARCAIRSRPPAHNSLMKVTNEGQLRNWSGRTACLARSARSRSPPPMSFMNSSCSSPSITPFLFVSQRSKSSRSRRVASSGRRMSLSWPLIPYRARSVMSETVRDTCARASFSSHKSMNMPQKVKWSSLEFSSKLYLATKGPNSTPMSAQPSCSSSMSSSRSSLESQLTKIR
mmetsp:Transcript_26225/g.49814  ORF Transcript_26225/g.49814 Transcript_26225/m.49814 type:complete len:246 (-) Transcript_26225:640-1377(-)